MPFDRLPGRINSVPQIIHAYIPPPRPIIPYGEWITNAVDKLASAADPLNQAERKLKMAEAKQQLALLPFRQKQLQDMYSGKTPFKMGANGQIIPFNKLDLQRVDLNNDRKALLDQALKNQQGVNSIRDSGKEALQNQTQPVANPQIQRSLAPINVPQPSGDLGGALFRGNFDLTKPVSQPSQTTNGEQLNDLTSARIVPSYQYPDTHPDDLYDKEEEDQS